MDQVPIWLLSLESPLCLVITATSPTSLSSSIHVLHEIEDDNWASEESPTLGCSIEISRDILLCCRYVCRMSN